MSYVKRLANCRLIVYISDVQTQFNNVHKCVTSILVLIYDCIDCILYKHLPSQAADLCLSMLCTTVMQVVERQPLRSASCCLLVVSWFQLDMYSHCALTVAGPTTLNSLSDIYEILMSTSGLLNVPLRHVYIISLVCIEHIGDAV